MAIMEMCTSELERVGAVMVIVENYDQNFYGLVPWCCTELRAFSSAQLPRSNQSYRLWQVGLNLT